MGEPRLAAGIRRVLLAGETRSFAALERRARAETALLAATAGIALLSIVVTARSLEVLPVGEPAAIERASTRDTPVNEVGVSRAVAPSEVALACAAEPAPPSSAAPARERERWTEHEFAAEIRRHAAPEAIAGAAERALAAEGPAAEKSAALRALYDVRGALAADTFRSVARREARPAGEGCVSVVRGALHWLGERAPSEREARSLLEALSTDPEIASELRAASACALVRAAPEDDLPRLQALFAPERDVEVQVSARSALATRDRRDRWNAPEQEE